MQPFKKANIAQRRAQAWGKISISSRAECEMAIIIDLRMRSIYTRRKSLRHRRAWRTDRLHNWSRDDDEKRNRSCGEFKDRCPVRNWYAKDDASSK